MFNKKLLLSLSTVFLFVAICESKENKEINKFHTSANFIVRNKIVSKNPGGYSFTTDSSKWSNSWLNCGNFEPFSRRTKVNPVGTSANEIIVSKAFLTRYNTCKSGYYDGARVRVYRIENARFVKIREDKIKSSVMEGWIDGVEGIQANKLVNPNMTRAETIITSWAKHACYYYYAVRAVSKTGEISSVSNYVKIFIPKTLLKHKRNLSNNLVYYKTPRSKKKIAPPNAPSNFKAELDAKAGVVKLSWEKSSSSNILGYRVVISYSDPNTFRGYHIYLENKPTDPQQFVSKNDLVFIDNKRFSFNKDKELSNRVYNAGQNQLSDPYFVNTKDKQWKLVQHPGNIPKELKITGGQTCIQIDMKPTSKVSLRKYNYSSLAQNWYKVLDPKKSYVVEFWAKQKGMTKPELTFSLTGALSKELKPVLFKLTSEWQKYTREWSIKTLLKTGRGVGQMCLNLSGQGTIWLDNWRVYEKGTDWMDMKDSYYKSLKESGMVFYRTHSLIKSFDGYSMQGYTNTAGGIEWRSLRANSFNTLPNQLKIMKKAGLSPWLQTEMCMNEKEWLGFVEYFCATYDEAKDSKESKPWAYKRYLQGHKKPYLDDFNKILFELSNETWNRLFRPFTFSSMKDAKTQKIYSAGEVYGLFQEYVIGIFRSSPYWTNEAKEKFKFVLGGWATQISKNGYGQSAARMSPNSDYMCIAAYNGGWDEKVSPTKSGPKGFFDALTFAPKVTIPRTYKFNAIKRAEGNKYMLGTYEAGPGYNLNGLNGVRMTKGMIEQENLTMKSLAAGTATLDVFLAQSSLGYKLQNFFTFNKGRNYWKSHAREENGGQAYPSWKALSMFNNHGLGDFLMIQKTSVPTWDIITNKGRHSKTIKNIPLVSIYATQKKDRLNLFVLSRKVKGYPIKGDQGFTKVSINLPIKKAKKITLYRMTGEPSDNNLDADNVKVEKIAIDASIGTSHFLVNETSGASAQGLPPASTFLYVFEGCEKIIGNENIVVTRAIGQNKIAKQGPIRFSILLPDKKTITKEDIKILGTSGAKTGSIKEMPNSLKMIYIISVNSMLKSGSVILEYKGQKSTVEFKIPVDKSLALATWYFPKAAGGRKDKYALSEKELTASNFMPIIEKPLIRLGKGYKMSFNRYYNDYGLATMPKWSRDMGKDAEDRYIAWIIKPKKNVHIILNKLVVGLWKVGKKTPLKYKLYYSLDGFKTSYEITLRTERSIMGCGYAQGQGIPATANLSSIKLLNDVSTPVEFRLHLSSGGPRGIGKLGQFRGEDLPDLKIMGMLLRYDQ